MAFMGSVERLGLGAPSSQVAALFGFDDVLVVVPLGVAVKPGFRANKKSQTAVDEMAGTANLTADAVQSRWSDSLTVRVADVERAEIRRSLQGGLFGTIRLCITSTGGGTLELLAHRSSKDSLATLLTTVLGDRFIPGS